MWPIGLSWVDLEWDCIWRNLTLTFKVVWGQKFKIGKNSLVYMKTFGGLTIGSPNLAIRCIMGRSRMGLYMAEFDLGGNGLVHSPIPAQCSVLASTNLYNCHWSFSAEGLFIGYRCSCLYFSPPVNKACNLLAAIDYHYHLGRAMEKDSDGRGM